LISRISESTDPVRHLHRNVALMMEGARLSPGGLLVVAVSGGPDSLALLHALDHLREDLGLRLHVAHLDHGLRGDASIADAEFVVKTCGKLGIGLTVDRADVPSVIKRRRLSLEEAAREVRFAFLARVAKEQRADAIALGHTADDQAETVLMRILRGTGITGLRGMGSRSQRVVAGVEVVLLRPLLGVDRRSTEEYCRALELRPRRDESNLSPKMTRNRVRTELLPLMEHYNPAVREALIRLSRSAAQDAAYIDAETDTVWRQLARRVPGGVALDKTALLESCPALQSSLLRRAVLGVKGDLRNIDLSHIDDIARLADGPAGRSLDLPGGVQLSVGYSDVTLVRSGDAPESLPPLGGPHELATSGETELPGWTVSARLLDRSASIESTGPDNASDEAIGREHTAYLDLDTLGGRLCVRSRIDGDRFQPLGMSHAKKLQDFMVNSKIPRGLRDRVPLAVSSKGIAWVVGWRIAEWAKVRDGGGRCLELRFQRG